MASEPIECRALVLRVSIHCEGCKKKVNKVLQSVHGVLRCDIDARSNRVVVTASRNLDPSILVARLRKSGKQAELWPEQPAPPQPPAERQGQDDGQSKPDEKPGPDNADAAEPSNPQPSSEPKQSNAGDTPKSAPESKEASNAGEEDTAAAEQHEAKGKTKQQPVHARVTVEYDPRGGDSYMPRMPQPQPIMSYNMARPSPGTSYYAAPPALAPMARPGLPTTAGRPRRASSLTTTLLSHRRTPTPTPTSLLLPRRTTIPTARRRRRGPPSRRPGTDTATCSTTRTPILAP